MKKRKMKKKHQEVKSRKASMSMRRFLRVFPPCFLIIAFALPAFAAEEPAQKFSEGIKETAASWTEIPKEMADTTEEKNVVGRRIK